MLAKYSGLEEASASVCSNGPVHHCVHSGRGKDLQEQSGAMPRGEGRAGWRKAGRRLATGPARLELLLSRLHTIARRGRSPRRCRPGNASRRCRSTGVSYTGRANRHRRQERPRLFRTRRTARRGLHFRSSISGRSRIVSSWSSSHSMPITLRRHQGVRRRERGIPTSIAPLPR